MSAFLLCPEAYFVKRMLRPLALAGKHATARIVAVLEWAEVENLREPAGSGRAVVETVTRSLPKAAAVRHHRALHFSDVAAALSRVDGHPRIGRAIQLAIRFGVLTAARQAEVRRATWEEFDFDSAVWTVPESHMKRHRPHRVPLSTGALAALEEARELDGRGGPAFRAPRGGKLGPTTVGEALRKAGINATGHGFRSSFKDWARHEGVDEILSEFALAHVEGSKTVATCPRRPAGEAPPGHAGVVRLRLPAGRMRSATAASAARGHEPVFSRRGRADGPGDVVQRRTERGQAVVVDRDDGDARVSLLRAELLVRGDQHGETGPIRPRQQVDRRAAFAIG